MDVLLIDIDIKIPNLALMKISAYYKLHGHNVGFDIVDPDFVYASVIFKKNKHLVQDVLLQSIIYYKRHTKNMKSLKPLPGGKELRNNIVVISLKNVLTILVNFSKVFRRIQAKVIWGLRSRHYDQ